MYPNLRTRLLAGGLALAAASPALAQSATQTAPLSEVVVTSTRLPTPLIDVAGAKIIDRAEIDRRGAIFGADVLATVPGVALTRNGAFGGVTSLRLRGAPSDTTLVLIDGVQMNDPSQPAGGYDFGSLDLADVDRIEILSGPQGSLWGSDAIGGVVNILTRETNGLRASAQYGSYDTWRLTGAAGFVGDKGAFSVNGSGMRTNGISKADARDGNTEADGFRNLTLGAAGRYEPTAGVKLEGRFRYNRSTTAYDGFGGKTGVIDEADVARVESLNGFVRATVAGPLGFTHRLSLEAASIDRRYDGPYPFQAKGGRTDVRWLAQQDPTRPVALAVGFDHDAAHQDTGSGRQTAGNTAGFAILKLSPASKIQITGSLRYDDPQRFKGKTTARLGGAVALGQGFSLAAAYGQGFKTPSLYQQTYPCFECTKAGPNPNLKPETAEGFDATLSWAEPTGRADLSVTAFRLRLHDRIDYRYPTGYLNIARARSKGIEAQGRFALGAGFNLRGSYAWTDAEDSLTGAQLGVPRHSGTAGLDWTGHKLQAAMLVRAQTGSPGSYGRVKGFTTVELSGGYAVTEAVRLTLRVENLTDRHYQQAYGYGEPGRSAYAGVSLKY